MLVVCRGGYVSSAESWDMQSDVEKCKNGNLFSVQVFVLLMFINRRWREVMKIVVLMICILSHRC